MKMVIFKQLGNLCITTLENYNARIQNARRIHTMKDFKTPEQIIEYYCKWFKSEPEDFIVKC